jgi:hypothetical protein
MRIGSLLILLSACGSNPSNGSNDLAAADFAGVDLTVSDLANVDFSGSDFAPLPRDMTLVPGNVAIQIYNQKDQADVNFVMFQDGAGAWQQLPDQPSGLYTFNVTDSKGRYGFAAGDVGTAGAPVGFMLQATVSDGNRLEVRLGGEPNASLIIMTARALNVPNGKFAKLQIGPFDYNDIGSPSGMMGVMSAPGVYDSLGQVFDGAAQATASNPIIYRRGFDATVPSPSPLPFDFASAEAVAPQLVTLAVSGAPASSPVQASSAVLLHSSHRQDFDVALQQMNVMFSADATGQASTMVPFLPAASVNVGDVQSVSASAALGNATVFAQLWINQGGAQTLTLPPQFNFTMQTWTQQLPRFDFAAIAGSTVYLVEWTAGNSNVNTLRWHTLITPAWFDGASPSYSFPSLSGVAGWDARLMPVSGSPAAYQGTALAYGTLDHAFTALLPGAYKPQVGDTLLRSRTQLFSTTVP